MSYLPGNTARHLVIFAAIGMFVAGAAIIVGAGYLVYFIALGVKTWMGA